VHGSISRKRRQAVYHPSFGSPPAESAAFFIGTLSLFYQWGSLGESDSNHIRWLEKLLSKGKNEWYNRFMDVREFRESLSLAEPPDGLPVTLAALWWDAKGDWARAHALVDELETPDGMAVHAYLHRKEGEAWNADYWYKRAGRGFHRAKLEEEWEALVEGLAG
jgi:hypothetical protein